MTVEQKRTFCRVCEPACGLVATVEDGRLLALAADKTQAQTLATLRDTVLPRLIAGQLRLPEAEAAIPA
jgi:hypothetical protein